MTKIFFSFFAGAVMGSVLLALEAANFQDQLVAQNQVSQERIGELEQLLEEAAQERPTFSAVPTQSDREALDFPERAALTDDISALTEAERTAVAQQLPQINTRFINLLELSQQQLTTVGEQMNNDVNIAMEAVQAKALTGNFVGFFQILEAARVEVAKVRVTISQTSSTVTELGTIIDSSVANEELNLRVDAYESATVAYLTTLNRLLDLLDESITGALPSQALFDEIEATTLLVNEGSQSVVDAYTNVIASFVITQ